MPGIFPLAALLFSSRSSTFQLQLLFKILHIGSLVLYA